MAEKVTVLLSSYNGEKYLHEQIDSVLKQKNVDVCLIVRDDGSTDRTLNILSEYGSRLKYYKGSNLGVGSSFMDLVYCAGLESDYYAFCDQDDVWLEDKLERAIDHIKDNEGPLLYASNQLLVDADSQRIGNRYDKSPDTSLIQILSDNRISGCTMVWNRALQALLARESSRPSEELLKKRIHDVWVGAVAASVGRICFDMDPGILYRQHGANIVGVRNKSIIREWSKKIMRPELRNGRSQLAKELYSGFFEEIRDIKEKELLQICGFYKSDKTFRKKLMENSEIPRHTGESRLGFRLKVMLGLF